MKWSQLPSLNALRAFYCLSEERSFSKAGESLNVTHAAISQQIRALENWFGTELVVKSGRKVELTEAGQRLAAHLSDGFDNIRAGVQSVVEEQNARPVQVSTSPAFASKWLMPRLPEFHEKHPEITLLINPTHEVVELKPGGTDIAIRYRAADRLDHVDEAILIADMAAVATPELIGNTDISHPAQLLNFPWLQELGTDEVAYWFRLQGLEGKVPTSITHMPGNLIMDGVMRGDGVSFTAVPFFKEEIKTGALRAYFAFERFGIYYIERAESPARRPVETFANWLLSHSDTHEKAGPVSEAGTVNQQS